MAGRNTSAMLRNAPTIRLMPRVRARSSLLVLLCAMYFVTYVDRVNISTAGPAIRADLGLTNTEFGMVLSAFSIPYAFFQAFGGYLADRFGPRRVLGVVGLVWAAATICTGFAIGLTSLFAARLALGFGEGASFPAATHAMARWLPPQRRSWAQGITHAFSRIGNAVTPIVVGAIIAVFDWRAAFWILGGVSLLWVVSWWFFYRDRPADHPKVTASELAELPGEGRRSDHPPIPWRGLLRVVLPVTFVDFCYGWMLWIYLTWLPSFLSAQFHLELSKFALFTALVLIAGVVGDALGGVVSDRLLHVTGDPRVARRLVLVIGLAGSFLAVLPTLMVHSLGLVTTFLAVAFFFLELCNPVLWATAMDMAPDHAGTAGGLMNTGFGVAGVLSPAVFGWLVDSTGDWGVPFGVSAGLLLLGCLVSLRLNITARLAGSNAG